MPPPARLSLQEQATVAGDGTVMFEFKGVPVGQVWVASIAVPGANPAATWTVRIGESLIGSFKGASTFGPIVIEAGETLELSGTTVTAGVQRTAVLVGSAREAEGTDYPSPAATAAAVAAVAGNSPALVVFTASGTFDKADHTNLVAVRFRAVAAGGGGGGIPNDGGNGSARDAGGGGGGGYAEAIVDVDDLAASEAVTVGTGGAGGAGSTGQPGADGGDSSVGAWVAATGGKGGGGGPRSTGNATAAGGRAGEGTVGDVLARGGSGGAGRVVGGAATFNGDGGGSMLGGSTAIASTAGGAGVTGSQFGGGGSGGVGGPSTAQDGGDGADGVVIVDLFF